MVTIVKSEGYLGNEGEKGSAKFHDEIARIVEIWNITSHHDGISDNELVSPALSDCVKWMWGE